MSGHLPRFEELLFLCAFIVFKYLFCVYNKGRWENTAYFFDDA